MIDLGLAIARVCAHQWFGSYVTMKWWDDLWLSESFAEFMAYYCLDGIKDKVTTIDKYASGWIPAVSRVMQGFREDQLSSTRPIRSEVANTSLATAYFDKITSGKGMLILKQLMVLMGSAKFFQGVTAFLNKYAWSNATMEQFMA